MRHIKVMANELSTSYVQNIGLIISLDILFHKLYVQHRSDQ